MSQDSFRHLYFTKKMNRITNKTDLENYFCNMYNITGSIQSKKNDIFLKIMKDFCFLAFYSYS